MVIQGVIRPPPEIRAVANRTALYVSKNGRAFEQKILNSEKGKTPKFAFLHQESPFHAYYEDRIGFYENGGTDQDEAKKKEAENKEEALALVESKGKEVPAKNVATTKASVLDPVAKSLITQRAKIQRIHDDHKEKGNPEKESSEEQQTLSSVTTTAPPALQFINVVAPASLSTAQIEVIQLVAQFAAIDGKDGPFLSQLTLREWNNPAFAFCQPRHGQFAYFSALVDAYRHILGLWTGQSSDDNVKELAGNLDSCLDQAAYRAAHAQDVQERTRQGREDGELLVARIDWHNFVVVETIDFDVDEKVVSLPPPPSLMTTKARERSVGNGMDESDDDDDEDEHIRVVPSYTPKVASNQRGDQMVIDPITGKSVRVIDLPEHMRIQLLDPKWAEERKKFQDKQKDSNLVSAADVASNIARFAQSRGDAFGKKEQAVLDHESKPKRSLDEINQASRQHAGPSLPPPPGFTSHEESAAKKPRMEVEGLGFLPPPPPPAPRTEAELPAPSSNENPFATAATPSATLDATSELIPEAVFAAALDKPDVNLQIRVPNDPSQMAWNFYGQIVSLSVSVMLTVKSVKQELSQTHLNNMPANKIQLKSASNGAFLKDALTLAALNIGPAATLELIPKTRGGRK